MLLRYIGLLLLTLGLLGGGISTSAMAATDVQPSQYEVVLTPSASSSSDVSTGEGGDGDLVSGGDGDMVNPGNQGATGNGSVTSGHQNATATKPISGRLPQLSEQQWVGFGAMLGIIMLLLLGIWNLSRKNRRS